ncbi:uncharacterized protein LOC128204310 [Mya arenaria]|uniref:uncharacterized protein LOC128204310 n=1 Tax=Mya arenaria TaxID=6604 RepID=UPI0022E85ABB|nr:uncharacterized protein LOC128204310 [Mya arenaria]
MPLIPPERDDHGSAEEYSEMCKVHANETLKFFCPDHGAFECGVCIVLDHRACSVQFVPDVAKGFSNTSEYRDQINMLREIQNDIQTCEDKVEEKSVSANDVHLVGLGDLKKFRKKINEYLDESERNIESFAEHLKAEVDEKIRELKKKYVQLKGIGDKSEQTLEIASSDEVRLYMTSTRSKKDIEGLKLSVDKIKKTCQQDNMRYEFKPDSVFEKMLSLQRNLGKMTITNEIQDDKSDNTADEFDIDESDQKCTLSDSITFDQVPSITNISIESTDDVYQTCSCKHPNCWKNEEEDHKKEVKEYWSCCITGMAVLSPGRLVVADSGCHSVKLIDTSNNKVLARYSTAPYPTQGQKPFDVTVVSNENIAVTYNPNTSYMRLRILSTENNTLSERYSVIIQSLRTLYVSYINDRFYLSDGSSISVRDDKINDAQVRKFEIKGNSCYRKPVLNASDGNAYYVTDKIAGTLTLLEKSL